MNFFAIWTMSLVCLVGGTYLNADEAVKEPNTASNRITGGVPAVAGEFPSMVAIFFSGTFQCGGTLLGPSHILTAAHCLLFFFASDPTSQLTVKLNTLTLSGSPGFIQRSVSKFILHPSYNVSNADNDIAILVMSTPININFVQLPTDPPAMSRIGTTNLTSDSATNQFLVVNADTKKQTAAVRAFSTYANQLAVIAGWGATSLGATNSETLQKTSVTIQNNTVCATQYPKQFIDGHQLCASTPGKDTCRGDDGGPIFVRGVQVGITSYKSNCTNTINFGLYTRVSAYVDWIKTTLASNPGPSCR